MTKEGTISYKSFIKDNCVRDKAIAQNCLLAVFKQEITSLSIQLTNLKRLLLKDGKYEDFNSELFNKLIKYIEQKAEDSLIKSNIGKEYLSKYGPIFIKQLSFCGFCLGIGIEVVRERITIDSAKMIYSAILNYYLAGKTLDCYKIEQLHKIISQSEQRIGSIKTQSDNYFQDFFPDVSPVDEEQLKNIKEYLNDPKIQEIISKENDEPKVIGKIEQDDEYIIEQLPYEKTKQKINPLIPDDFPINNIKNLTDVEIIFLKKLEKKCNECTKNISDCIENLRKVENIIDLGREKIRYAWKRDSELQSCIAKKLLEKC